MPSLSVMFKTVSTDCNLDCSYCYYRESLEGEQLKRRIDLSMLQELIPQYMNYVADAHQANLSWQGGEPTLMGLDFFRWLVELEAVNARPPTAISNTLQTNGTLLNDEWGSFLKTYDFLVGVSLDGPEDIHNLERKDRGGHGSFHRVIAGIDVLRRHKVDFNILCVIGPHNVNKVRELMEFFLSEDFNYLQFMPAMAFQSTEPLKQPDYLITPEQYAKFLIELFDEWYQNGIPTISVRTFDNLLQSYLGVPNDLCVHSANCDSGIVVEYNGDTYPCDFYIHPRWKLGNIFQKSLKEMAESPEMKTFIGRKHPLPVECQQCEWKNLCKGGCARNRLILADERLGTGYFCQSCKRFFRHADSRMSKLAQRLANYRRYLQRVNDTLLKSQLIPTQNEPCPCGSGQIHRNCCGDPLLKGSCLFQP